MITLSHTVAANSNCLATTGILNLSPGSVNTIPGEVSFSLDVRGETEERVEKVERDLKGAFVKIARGENVGGQGGVKGRGCTMEWRLATRSKEVRFHPDCVKCVEDSTKGVLGEDKWEGLSERMISGAGHDSVYTSRRCPSSMVFVPCREGVSHNSREYCKPQDCANGAQVLLGALLRYDRLRASKETGLSSISG